MNSRSKLTVLLLCCHLFSPHNTFAQRNFVRGAEVTGTFRSYFKGAFKSSYNEVAIKALGQNRLKVQMQLLYPYQLQDGSKTANLGSASGIAKIQGDTAIFIPEPIPDTENDGQKLPCTITLTFVIPGRLNITTQNDSDGYGCGFGHNVYADGNYKKVNKVPQFHSETE